MASIEDDRRRPGAIRCLIRPAFRGPGAQSGSEGRLVKLGLGVSFREVEIGGLVLPVHRARRPGAPKNDTQDDQLWSNALWVEEDQGLLRRKPLNPAHLELHHQWDEQILRRVLVAEQSKKYNGYYCEGDCRFDNNSRNARVVPCILGAEGIYHGSTVVQDAPGDESSEPHRKQHENDPHGKGELRQGDGRKG